MWCFLFRERFCWLVFYIEEITIENLVLILRISMKLKKLRAKLIECAIVAMKISSWFCDWQTKYEVKTTNSQIVYLIDWKIEMMKNVIWYLKLRNFHVNCQKRLRNNYYFHALILNHCRWKMRVWNSKLRKYERVFLFCIAEILCR